MPHIAQGHERHYGSYVGNNQHCVSLVRECSGLPHTSAWRRGEPVQGSGTSPAPGTVIATFDANGRYGNHTDGRSHAAVLLAVNSDGLLVADQWVGQPCHQRVIQFRNGRGDPVNDGNAYHIVELQDDGDG